MRKLIAVAHAAAMVSITGSVAARTRTLDIPVEVIPNRSVYVLWPSVRNDNERTVVKGYVRMKRWFARTRGDLHIVLLKDGREVACQETAWRKYRFHTRGQWRFIAAFDAAPSKIDSVRISYEPHDGSTVPSSCSANSLRFPQSIDPE